MISNIYPPVISLFKSPAYLCDNIFLGVIMGAVFPRRFRKLILLLLYRTHWDHKERWIVEVTKNYWGWSWVHFPDSRKCHNLSPPVISLPKSPAYLCDIASHFSQDYIIKSFQWNQQLCSHGEAILDVAGWWSDHDGPALSHKPYLIFVIFFFTQARIWEKKFTPKSA